MFARWQCGINTSFWWSLSVLRPVSSPQAVRLATTWVGENWLVPVRRGGGGCRSSPFSRTPPPLQAPVTGTPDGRTSS